MSSTHPVFISYSHKDQAYLDRLTTFLEALRRKDLFSTWDDREIQSGDYWSAEIQEAIAEAKIAILLISADFLASDFIQNEEIPALQKRQAIGEIAILPVIVKPCPWKKVDWLEKIQVYPREDDTLSGADEEHDREHHYNAIAEDVYRLVQDLDAPDEEAEYAPEEEVLDAPTRHFTPTGPLEVDGYYTHAGLIDFIQRSSYLVPEEETREVLALFRTKDQRSWLVSTNQALFLLLDDAKTRARQGLVQWKEPLQEIQNVRARPRADKRYSGLVDIGPRQNWLYSFSIHPKPDELTAAILGMVKRAMRAKEESATDSP